MQGFTYLGVSHHLSQWLPLVNSLGVEKIHLLAIEDLHQRRYGEIGIGAQKFGVHRKPGHVMPALAQLRQSRIGSHPRGREGLNGC